MRTTRIGMLVPSSNVTMETELPAMMAARRDVRPDETFTFHSARMRMTHVSPEQLQSMNDQVPRATTELADLAPDAIVSACLVAIMAQGPGYHCTAEEDIARAWTNRGTAPIVTSAGALLSAMEHLGARRVAMITPYQPALTELVAGYIQDAGVEVVDVISLGVSDNLEVGRLDPDGLIAQARALDISSADAVVLSACVQMPSLSAIATVEAELDMPVISAATATCFETLRSLGLDTVVPGAGYLLSERVPLRS